jgi:hypothetical protein
MDKSIKMFTVLLTGISGQMTDDGEYPASIVNHPLLIDQSSFQLTFRTLHITKRSIFLLC